IAVIPGTEEILVAGDMPGSDAVVLADVPKKKCITPIAPLEHIMRLTSTGAIVWSRSLLDTTLQTLHADSSGGFAFYSQMKPVATGGPKEAWASVVRVSDAGKLLWEQGFQKSGDPTMGASVSVAGIDSA